jgi:hypothetical protein
MIATSSILSFDIYGTYINKNPTNKQLIRWSHIGVIFTALAISTIATGFHYGGVDMSWLLYALGNMVNPGVFPTCFALFWKGQTKAAAIISPIVGMACGFSVWFGTAYAYYGEVSIASTGSTMPCLFGCVTAFFVPLFVSVFVSLVKPETFDWAVFGEIRQVKADGETVHDQEEHEVWFTPERIQYMKRMSRWAAFWSALTLTGHVLLWPLPMYGAKMVFSKEVSLHNLLLTNVEFVPSSCKSRLTKDVVFHGMDCHCFYLSLVYPSCWQRLSNIGWRLSADMDSPPWQSRSKRDNDSSTCVSRLGTVNGC